jgi:hypothetical protein
MMYRNASLAPWRRTEKLPVPPGQTFEPTPFELECIRRRGYRHLVPVLPAEEELIRAAETAGQDERAAAEARGTGWPLRMSPERYLRLYPDGPHAESARAIMLEGQTGEPAEGTAPVV